MQGAVEYSAKKAKERAYGESLANLEAGGEPRDAVDKSPRSAIFGRTRSIRVPLVSSSSTP